MSRVGNESLAIPLYGLLIYLSLRIKDGHGGMEWAAIVLGLGLLTKAYFLTAIPAFGLVCGCALVGAGRPHRRIISIRVGIALSTVGLIAAWWYWRNYFLAGSLIWVDATPTPRPLSVEGVAGVTT